jgi:hypothetical protein
MAELGLSPIFNREETSLPAGWSMESACNQSCAPGFMIVVRSAKFEGWAAPLFPDASMAVLEAAEIGHSFEILGLALEGWAAAMRGPPVCIPTTPLVAEIAVKGPAATWGAGIHPTPGWKQRADVALEIAPEASLLLILLAALDCVDFRWVLGIADLDGVALSEGATGPD